MQTTLATPRPKAKPKFRHPMPEFYYEWGNEPFGYVTIGMYVDDIFINCGQIKKSEALENGLVWFNPHA